MPRTAPARTLTLHDRLSHLGFLEASRLLGARGATLIQRGGALDVPIPPEIARGATRVEIPIPRARAGDAIVTICLADDARKCLRIRCSACTRACEHAGAALALILKEKIALGLAAPPPPREATPATTEEALVARALEERAQRAREERATLRSANPDEPWTDYTITSALSGRSYRVAMRGEERGVSYCSCPDFRKNTLGTCKHVLHALDKIRRRFTAVQRRRPYRRREISVHLGYDAEVTLRVAVPDDLPADARKLLGPLVDRPVEDVGDLVRRVARLERAGHAVNVYPDAEEHIQARLFAARIRARVDEIRADPARHPLRKELLREELLPYQLDGVAFAVGAGRAVLADDMGLGKTIQAIGVAELFAREAQIRKVLIVCPASVKAQWRGEIERFADRSCQLVSGGNAERHAQYAGDAFFTVCNYEQVLRDLRAIETVAWDLIVLDEGQRIKNWEAKTSDVIKRLRSRFALVLSGTPLENRLEELYSVVEFVDPRRLGPAFRFFERHRVTNDDGKVTGYQRLEELRAQLAPILLRRTREGVAQQLPPRTTEVVRIAPTAEQRDLHDASMRVVAQIVRKPYLTEMDLLRLRKGLLTCRLAANGTYLVDKLRPGYSSKLVELEALLVRLVQEGRKIIVFSEWTTMLDLVEERLRAHAMSWVRLDGSVPQGKRQQLVRAFQHDPTCRLFLTTNAGSTGLNLQAADTIVNVDLPWNPAILEQRIGRAHRMGQRRPVHAYLLVTEGTLEENLLATLSAKRALALAALDPASDLDRVDLSSGMDELKQRLEVLLGARPPAPVDESERERAEVSASAPEEVDRERRLAEAGGQLVVAALRLLGELLPAPTDAEEPIASLVRAQLAELVHRDPDGHASVQLRLPADAAIPQLARTIAHVTRRAAAGEVTVH